MHKAIKELVDAGKVSFSDIKQACGELGIPLHGPKEEHKELIFERKCHDGIVGTVETTVSNKGDKTDKCFANNKKVL